MLVADMHEGVAAVRQAQAARGRLCQMEGIAVAVREAEMRAQHELAVRALIDTHVLTEAFAQEAPERSNVKSHRGSVA